MNIMTDATMSPLIPIFLHITLLTHLGKLYCDDEGIRYLVA